MSSPSVIAGLVPAIPLRRAKQCDMNRDGRDKPGHDGASYRSAASLRTSTIRRNPDAAMGQALACANPCSTMENDSVTMPGCTVRMDS